MSDKGAEKLAGAIVAVGAIAASAYLLCAGHETAAVWMFVLALVCV